MDAPAPFIVRTGWDIMVFSPAVIQFCTVQLFPGGPGVTGGNDRVILIDDDSCLLYTSDAADE